MYVRFYYDADQLFPFHTDIPNTQDVVETYV